MDTPTGIVPVEPPGLSLRLLESLHAHNKSSDRGFPGLPPPSYSVLIQFTSIILQAQPDPGGFTQTQTPYIYIV